MEMTFGEQFESFTMSLDTVGSSLCESVRDLFRNYVTDILKFDFYHIMVDGTQVDDKPGLHTATTSGQPWCNDGSGSVPIHGGDGAFFAQSTFSYEKRLPLWITGKNNEPLNDASEYIDHWSDTINLPAFYARNKPKAKTSIVIPLRYGERVFGFICIESNNVLKFHEQAITELEKVTTGIGIVLWLHEAHLNQHKCAHTAFSKIEKSVTDKTASSPLLKPRIFIASSQRADRSVMGSIHNIIDEFSEQFEKVFWHELNEPGDINSQIIKEMNRSRLGICYLSEPTNNSDHQYSDNANVIFEAGMFKSLEYAVNATTQAWVPIREPDSPAAPFDIRQQRTIVVSRLSNGDLNKEQFEADLEVIITDLVGI